MFRASDIIDLPVLSLKAGRRLCTVKSLILDTSTNKIYGFLCKERLVKRCIDIVPYKSLIRLDFNGVTVYDGSAFKRVSINTILDNTINFDKLAGKFILNNDGELIGRITDIYFEALSGKITSYEISEGYFDDFINGRKIINCLNKDDFLLKQLVNNIKNTYIK